MDYEYESLESIQKMINNLRYDDNLRVHAFVGELIDIIKKYGALSFGDLLEIYDTWLMFDCRTAIGVNIRPIKHSDHHFIWTDSDGFCVLRDKDGYRICIPWNKLKKED